MSPLVISIEGGIGVGKSTLFAKLKAKFKENVSIAFVSEPAEEWTNYGFLQGMYDGTINRATFQHMVLMSLTADLLKALKKKPDVIISERSPWGMSTQNCDQPATVSFSNVHQLVFLLVAQATASLRRQTSKAKTSKCMNSHGNECVIACRRFT